MKDKLFWILLPILVASIISAAMGTYNAVDARLTEVEQLAQNNKQQIAVNAVPELRADMKEEFKMVHDELSTIQLQNLEQTKLLCRHFNGDC